MDRHQRFREPGGENPSGRDGQRATFPNRLQQGGPGNIKRGQPRSRPSWVGVEDRSRTKALYPLGQFHLDAEALDEPRVIGQLGMDHLDGHRSPAGRGAEIDAPHAPPAQPRAQSVRPDPVRIASPECAHAPTLPSGGVRDNPALTQQRDRPAKLRADPTRRGLSVGYWHRASATAWTSFTEAP